MKNLAIFLVILAMFLFGCSTHYEANYNASVNGTYNATVNGTSGTHANNTAPSTGTNTSGTAPVNGQGNGASSGADLSGKNYTELLSLGSPSECSVSYTGDQGTKNLNLFFDGKGTMRVEEPVTGSQDCPSNVLIYTGDMANGGVVYMNCPTNKEILGTDMMANDIPCDWLSTNVSAEYGGIGSFGWGIGTFSTQSLDYVNASEYDCKPWTADKSMLDTSGHICYQ